MFLDGLELPRGLERKTVMDGHYRYELNVDDSRSLAAVGAFRVVAERDPVRSVRRGGEAAKWEQDLAELRKNLQQGPQKGHKLIKSVVSVRPERP